MTSQIRCAGMAAILIGLSVSLAAEDWPGGIVFSNGQDAVYRSLSSGGTVHLTEDFDKPVGGPVTVSDDGMLVAWFSDGEIFLKQLPDGTPFPLRRASRVRTLAISPRCDSLAFETRRGVEVIPIRAVYSRNNWLLQGHERRSFDHCRFPVWRMKKPLLGDLSHDDKKARRLLQIIEEHMEQLVEEIVQKTSVSEAGVIQLGGTFVRLRAAVPLELRVDYGAKSYPKEFLLQNRDNLGKVLVIHSMSVVEPSAAQQELACFDAQAQAIYRYVLGSRGRWESARRKTQIQGEACRGLVVKPDGTLTYLSGTSVYSESGEVIAGDIDGMCVQWVDDDTFIFRGKDGALYSWENGERKRLLDYVPEQFCYTPVPVSGSSGTFTTPWEGDFWLGNLWFRWHWPYRSSMRPNISWAKYANFRVKGAKEEFEYAFVDPADAEDRVRLSQEQYSAFTLRYVDPGKIVYSPDTPKYIKEHDKNTRRIVPLDLKFPLDKVLVIRKGNEYLTMKVVNAGYPWVHVGKIYHESGGNKDGAGRFVDIYYLPSDAPHLTLEWRRWNAQE